MSQIIDFLIKRFMQFGKIPMCNGIPSRALHIGNFCFPLCYRCMFAVMIFLITLYVCYRRKKRYSLKLACLCLLPMIVDGSLQTFLGIMSTNIRRSITGGLFGFGLGCIVNMIFMKIDALSS